VNQRRRAWRASAALPLFGACLLALVVWPSASYGICDVIPTALTTFRGTLGSTSHPFAGPGDRLEITLDARCDGEASPGFSGGDNDQAVTLVFAPPSGPRHFLTLARNCALFDASHGACAAQSGARSSCLPANATAGDQAIVRVDQRTLQFRFPDTDGRLGACVGGGEAGKACLTDDACGAGGACTGGEDDDLTLAGPAAIVVTRADQPVPCEVLTGTCARRPELLACIDRIFADDGSCGSVLDETFSRFTALPPPNDYSALCTAPVPPCAPALNREVRFAIDAQGNMLVPMDWRGILVDDDAVPVARLLRGETTIEAFVGRGMPLLLPDSSILSSFSPRGIRVAPIFDPQLDATTVSAAAFFGTADAEEGILRVARHALVIGQCSGGDPGDVGLPCIDGQGCPTGTCGTPTYFVDGAPTAIGCTSDVSARRITCAELAAGMIECRDDGGRC